MVLSRPPAGGLAVVDLEKMCVRVVMLCYAKSLQSCPTLCDPIDCSLPGSSVHEILQAGILQWVAMPSSGGSLQARHGI